MDLAPDDALTVLEYWHASAAQLTFVYHRSGGAPTQIGRGRIRQATSDRLEFDTPEGRLEILVGDAAFEFGAVADADGLLVFLRNQDRLYLWEGPRAGLARPQ